jgi:hypothetical protein
MKGLKNLSIAIGLLLNLSLLCQWHEISKEPNQTNYQAYCHHSSKYFARSSLSPFLFKKTLLAYSSGFDLTIPSFNPLIGL